METNNVDGGISGSFGEGTPDGVESVTCHKLAVVIFIREFCLLKQETQEMMLFEYTMAPKYRKDFCMLVLKLIQCPDMEFKELEKLLTSGKYNLLNAHIQNFCSRLKQIYEDGVGALMDCVAETVSKLMVEPHETNCVISKSSVLGFYLRRMMLYLSRLSFSQVVSVYRSFCSYYEKGRPGSLMKCLSKDKLNTTEASADFPMSLEEKKNRLNIENIKKRLNLDSDSDISGCQWSRKQAELFTAQQATLLQTSEPQAMFPPLLQNTITKILRDNPDYSEAHFLSYLNSLRERDLSGALDNLYSCFDHNVIGTNTSGTNVDRNRAFRHASLNLAVLHAQFGHKHQALLALKEAMVMSQEAGDGSCLQQAAMWARHMGAGGFGIPSIRSHRLLAPCARHRSALTAQAYVQHAALRKITPSQLFGLLMKSDVIHCQHSMIDLVQTSLVNRASLWSMYGKTEMVSLCCQLLLCLNTAGAQETEALCLAVSGVVQIFAQQGHYTYATAILQYINERVPRPPHCQIWMRTQHIVEGSKALLAGKWQDVEQAVEHLASIDQWESQLMKAELHLAKGEPVFAKKCLTYVLDFCDSEEYTKLYLVMHIKAMILMAQTENCNFVSHSSSLNSIAILNDALTLAEDNYIDYLAAITEMHVASVQLQMGCVTKALVIVQKVLATVMSHGGPYDRARATLLYVKCRIAAAPKFGKGRKNDLNLCIELLNTVKANFTTVNALSRIKDVLYLQTILFNELGNTSERNKVALEYRQLDEQHSIKISNSLVTCF